MAMVKCCECRKRISCQANPCPHCGVPRKVAPPPTRKESFRRSVRRAGIIVLCTIGLSVIASILNHRAEERTAEAAAQAAADKQKFIAEIDQRYGELNIALESNDAIVIEKAFKTFRKHGQFEYKNVAELHSEFRTRLLLQSLEKVQSPRHRLKTYKELCELHPDDAQYSEALHVTRAEVAEIERLVREEQLSTRRKTEQVAQLASVQLVIESWRWTIEHGYATAEGQVTNVTQQSLVNLQAVVQYKTADGTFITSDSSLIEYQPLLPGQTSPFKVMTISNPAMSNASLTFKRMFGGQAVAVRRAKYEEMKAAATDS